VEVYGIHFLHRAVTEEADGFHLADGSDAIISDDFQAGDLQQHGYRDETHIDFSRKDEIGATRREGEGHFYLAAYLGVLEAFEKRLRIEVTDGCYFHFSLADHRWLV